MVCLYRRSGLWSSLSSTLSLSLVCWHHAVRISLSQLLEQVVGSQLLENAILFLVWFCSLLTSSRVTAFCFNCLSQRSTSWLLYSLLYHSSIVISLSIVIGVNCTQLNSLFVFSRPSVYTQVIILVFNSFMPCCISWSPHVRANQIPVKNYRSLVEFMKSLSKSKKLLYVESSWCISPASFSAGKDFREGGIQRIENGQWGENCVALMGPHFSRHRGIASASQLWRFWTPNLCRF
jgi:hypothetical protein